MTAHERFDRVFADVLADLAQPAYPDYIEDAIDVATRKRQRPAWAFPERWLPMTSLTRATPFAPGMPWRRLVVLAVVALLATAIAIAAIGSLRETAPLYGPARNGLIVFEGPNFNLFSRDPETGAVDELAATGDYDVFPFFSRDGTKLAYFRVDPETAETANESITLYVSNLDGTGASALLGPDVLQDAAWAPNSREIAVLAKVEGGSQVSIVGLDGSRRTLAVAIDSIHRLVGWRPPDGQELILQGRETTEGFFAVRSDGSGFRRIPISGSTVTPDGEVALTPDGRHLVYTWLASPIDTRVVDLETGEVRRFGGDLPVPEGGPGSGPMHVALQQLSSDGTKIVLGRYWDGDPVEDRINHQIWVASLAGDGGDAVPVSPVVRSQGGTNPFLVFVPPDGSMIVVHRLGTSQTWISDGDGRNRREVDWGELYAVDWQRLAP